MAANTITLPKTISHWIRSDAPRIITSENIFEYMDGAGELYLGYRFHHLAVYDYGSEKNNNVLVELYFMEHSDDAFGLLSLDWGGDPVLFTEDGLGGAYVAPARALYGAGLLRVWSDTVYARVLGLPETPASKKVVLDLGKAIIRNRKKSPEPDFLKSIPLSIEPDWKMNRKRLSYFRSYLALNSVFYLSHENILDIDLSVEGVIATYEKISGAGNDLRAQVFLVKYETPERALNALDHFQKTYLPEHEKKFKAESAGESPEYFDLEDGWMGYALINCSLAVVFGCPDRETAQAMLQAIEPNLKNKGTL
ncbi:MAG: hypothetical protein JRD68_13605 [Deltaproteobacteria bacterium]|nr:hypothetical protein [Deltaproteobacteria bacterium]